MSTPILATKLHVPTPRPNIVARERLLARLNEGLHDNRGFARALSIISAPAGFGKTTLLADWLAGCDCRAAWLSLDESDSDPARFLAYLTAALQTISPKLGEGVAGMLGATHPPVDTILTNLINEVTTLSEDFYLVLDDYHMVDSLEVDRALAFLLEHIPPCLHLVVATREDPNLPLARLRARNQLTELRAADLRFTPDEAAEFLNRVMGLELSGDQVAALERRTEGWIAGLQLAAISMRGAGDAAGFIQSFTGSHHYILDYLIEEVLDREPAGVQSFLLQTSILERLEGSLCDALTGGDDGRQMLAYLENANLFITPLDNERSWYRYHHLFADLLRRRLRQGDAAEAPEAEELHRRASEWYEQNGLEVEAFQHAAAANDVARAGRLIAGQGMPLQYRGAMRPVMNWLASLPEDDLDANPALRVTYASALTMIGKPVDQIEEALQTAEAALAAQEGSGGGDTGRDLAGQIAAIRAMLAIPANDLKAVRTQSRRALEFLHPDNLPARTTAAWTLGYAYQLQGNRAAAIRAYEDTIAISQASGNTMMTIAAATSLGQVYESENRLRQAAENYRHVLALAGNPPFPGACEAHLGLARIHYQWNDLETAQKHADTSLKLARQMENIDTPAASMTFLGILKLARGRGGEAGELFAQAEEFLRGHQSQHRMPEIAAAQALLLIHRGDLKAAEALAEQYALPFSLARARLASGDAHAALEALEAARREAERQNQADVRLRAAVLGAVAHQALGDGEKALELLEAALAAAEPEGFVRIFMDEGAPMADLLREASRKSAKSSYARRLLEAFGEAAVKAPASQELIEPLTERELDVLRMLGSYLTGPEIARELMVSLNTMRTHSKNIYTKLGVNSRQEAVRRAEELDIL